MLRCSAGGRHDHGAPVPHESRWGNPRHSRRDRRRGWRAREANPRSRGYRVAEEWTETVRLRTDSGPNARGVTFRKAHHGPIVAVRDAVLLALRIARREEGGTVPQFHAMARARSFDEFRDAVGRLRQIWLSIGYADADGNTWYFQNGAVPRRVVAAFKTLPEG
jgi:acyl-homoserine lactone acylase PvdQ